MIEIGQLPLDLQWRNVKDNFNLAETCIIEIFIISVHSGMCASAICPVDPR